MGLHTLHDGLTKLPGHTSIESQYIERFKAFEIVSKIRLDLREQLGNRANIKYFIGSAPY